MFTHIPDWQTCIALAVVFAALVGWIRLFREQLQTSQGPICGGCNATNCSTAGPGDPKDPKTGQGVRELPLVRITTLNRVQRQEETN